VVSAEADLYVIDLKTAEFRRLVRPAADAEFKTFVPQTGVAVFSTVTRGGTHLWISGRKLASANEFLAQIAEGSLRKVEYHGLDGQSLHTEQPDHLR
jgi:hypothetical protein